MQTKPPVVDQDFSLFGAMVHLCHWLRCLVLNAWEHHCDVKKHVFYNQLLTPCSLYFQITHFVTTSLQNVSNFTTAKQYQNIHKKNLMTQVSFCMLGIVQTHTSFAKILLNHVTLQLIE